jgi:TolA-binding protein
MTNDSKQSSQLVASWAQFVAICVGIGTILLYIGRKDQQLASTTEQVKELSSIVSDLAKSQISLTMKDQQTEERLRDLALRLERLERNKL